eukprot:CFRG2046T1
MNDSSLVRSCVVDIVTSSGELSGQTSKKDVEATLFRQQMGSHYREQSGSEVGFEDISYTVKDGKEDKKILHKLSGFVRPGSLCAVMGSTGGGKSTLLDVLAGRKDSNNVQGSVTIDGKPRLKTFKYQCGYVMQDDIVLGSLTVRENILFSARLRLPKSMSDDEKQEKVDSVIDELGLTKVAHSIVGNQVVRGISGGERKRVNVGLELVKAPSVLFLDEPTTGLDSSTAERLVELLKRLTKRGRTIILSIHQPRYSIFKKFDQLLLLTAGEFVYAGPAQMATNYFRDNLGHECEPFNNPADFFLDITNAESLARMAIQFSSSDTINGRLIGAQEINNMNGTIVSPSLGELAPPTTPGLAENVVSSNTKTLAERFRESSQWEEMKNALKTSRKVARKSMSGSDGAQVSTYPIGTFRQTLLLTKRNLLNIIRNPVALIMQVIVKCVFGLIAGTLYFQVGDGVDGLQNRIGALFFALMGAVFANLSSVEIFLSERPIFMNEKRGGYYSTEAYFMAKVGIDLLLARIVPTLFYATISFWMVGLSGGMTGYLVYLMILEIVAMVAVGICFLVSSMVSVYAVANILLTAVYVIMMVFGGLLVNVNTMPSWLSWIQYLSIFRYGFEALAASELDGMTFNCPENVQCLTGNEYLAIQGFDADNLWFDVGMLMFYWVLYMSLCLLQLRWSG